MRQIRTVLCCVVFVVAGTLTPVRVRAGDPAQFFNEHATEKSDGATAATDAAAIKRAIVADFNAGRFESGSEWVARLDTPGKPAAGKLKAWATTFREQQYRPWAAQRRREFEQEIKRAQLLVERHQESFAAYHLALAYAVAPAKDALRAEDWFLKLTRAANDAAERNEKTQNWLACWRIDTNLSQIDPGNTTLKQRLVRVSRRIRMLRLYAPEQFRRLQDNDDRDRVAAGESPAPDAKMENAAVGIKPPQDAWRDAVAGVTRAMLNDAVSDMYVSYIRAVSFRDVIVAGLQSVEDLMATPGLEKSFPAVSDATKKKAFEAEVQALLRTTQGRDPKQVNGRVFSEAIKTLLDANSRSLKLPDEVLIHEFADGTCEALDAKTSMIWPVQVAEYTRAAAQAGAGVGLRLRVAGDGEVVVAGCIEGAPGAAAGIRASDVIESVDGRRVAGLNAEEAADLIAGKPASPVTIVVRHAADGRRQRCAITRQQVKGLSSVAGWRRAEGASWDYLIDPAERVAYVAMTSLQSKTAAEVDNVLDELKRAGARGIVLDLRDNSGGLLSAAKDVTRRFVKSGLIVSTRAERETREKAVVTYAAEGGERRTTDLPMVVLVNASTYGGAEVVAGALRDHGRAVVVGEQTAGRGDVQMLYPLADRTAYLKMTTHAFYRPNGKSVTAQPGSKEWGVEPTVPGVMGPVQTREAADARDGLTSGRGAAAAEKALITDFQLSAALLVMRLRLNGIEF